MPTTEIATVPLVSGSDIGDPNNQSAVVIKDAYDTISKQEGFQGLRFGMASSPGYNPYVKHDWDSKQSHLDFMAKDIYTPFRENLKPILGGDITVQHQDFKPEGGLNASMSAPVTEVATFYFDGAPPDDAYESCKSFIEICEKEGNAKIYGWSYGITQEEIEREGVKGYGAVLTIGWENVQAHMDFRTTQCFKDHISKLRQTSKKIEMHHVQFMNAVQ